LHQGRGSPLAEGDTVPNEPTIKFVDCYHLNQESIDGRWVCLDCCTPLGASPYVSYGCERFSCCSGAGVHAPDCPVRTAKPTVHHVDHAREILTTEKAK
jgi:hypothetical protein